MVLSIRSSWSDIDPARPRRPMHSSLHRPFIWNDPDLWSVVDPSRLECSCLLSDIDPRPVGLGLTDPIRLSVVVPVHLEISGLVSVCRIEAGWIGFSSPSCSPP